MKYGESIFDILYLLTAVVAGIYLLCSKKNTASRLMGFAVLTLGVGDAFHLVPRVLNYFIESDFTVWLGAGKLVTSVTMTIFYVLMYEIFIRAYNTQRDKRISLAVYVIAAVRIALCLLPQNDWFSGSGSVLWGTVRNIPFVMLGAIIVLLYFRRRDAVRSLRFVWLFVTLSFLFYIPVAVGASLLPMLGMLMLPKTICYVAIIVAFLRYEKYDAIK